MFDGVCVRSNIAMANHSDKVNVAFCSTQTQKQPVRTTGTAKRFGHGENRTRISRSQRHSSMEVVTNGMSQQFALMERANELNRRIGPRIVFMGREGVLCSSVLPLDDMPVR